MVNLNYVSKDQFYNSKIYSFLVGTLILCNTLLTSSVVEHGKEKKIKVLCEQTREMTHDFLDYV